MWELGPKGLPVQRPQPRKRHNPANPGNVTTVHPLSCWTQETTNHGFPSRLTPDARPAGTYLAPPERIPFWSFWPTPGAPRLLWALSGGLEGEPPPPHSLCPPTPAHLLLVQHQELIARDDAESGGVPGTVVRRVDILRTGPRCSSHICSGRAESSRPGPARCPLPASLPQKRAWERTHRDPTLPGHPPSQSSGRCQPPRLPLSW